MADPDLNFIARQLASLIGEVRSLRDEVRVLYLIRNDVRIATSEVRHLNDSIRASVPPSAPVP